MFNSKNIKVLTIVLILFAGINTVNAQWNKLQKVMDLSGRWNFSIGDNEEWAKADFDDTNWEKIYVPEKWENQGFHGYDGYAWYRKKFIYNDKLSKFPLYVSFGYIDDVDEVYLNGKLIGKTGSFPPNYSSAYNAKRIYRIPNDLLNYNDENVFAIRIYDDDGEGGIVRGEISILMDIDAVPLDLSLQGEWKFKINDCNIKDNKACDFSTWDDIIVPGYWDDQGYKNFDGIACYALKFNLNNEFKGKDVVLVLGKIDDVDMVYLNGKFVGKTGEFGKYRHSDQTDIYKAKRGYYLPKNALVDDGENVIFVRVLDFGSGGGIYDGQIGLITQEHYINFWHNKRKKAKNRW